jgi:hypothetical protein
MMGSAAAARMPTERFDVPAPKESVSEPGMQDVVTQSTITPPTKLELFEEIILPHLNSAYNFSPQVKDLTPEGFPLIGGRIEYLSGRTVAALVYGRRMHVINLFTWPAASSAGNLSEWSRNGYNLVHWTDSGMTYWAVSDIPGAELQQFKNLYLR